MFLPKVHQLASRMLLRVAAQALCILSHFAFFDVYKTFLRQLFCISQTADRPLPVERYIANIVQEVQHCQGLRAECGLSAD